MKKQEDMEDSDGIQDPGKDLSELSKAKRKHIFKVS